MAEWVTEARPPVTSGLWLEARGAPAPGACVGQRGPATLGAVQRTALLAPSPQSPQPRLGPSSQLVVCPGTCWRARSCTRSQSMGPSRTPDQEGPSGLALSATCQELRVWERGPPSQAWGRSSTSLLLPGAICSGEPHPGTGQDRRGGITPLASLRGTGSLVRTSRVPVPQLDYSHTATRACQAARAAAHTLAHLASAASAQAFRGHVALMVAITTLPSAQGGRGPLKSCPLEFPRVGDCATVRLLQVRGPQCSGRGWEGRTGVTGLFWVLRL